MQTLRRSIGKGFTGIFVVLGLAACGAATNDRAAREEDDGRTTVASSHGLQLAPKPEEEQLLGLVLRGISSEVVVRFADVPADFRGALQTMNLPADGIWLEVDLPVPPDAERAAGAPADSVRHARLRWEGRLIVGAYRDAAVSQGLRQVVGASFFASGMLMDRGLISFEPGTLGKASGQSDSAATDLATIRRAVDEGSAAGDLSLRDLEFEAGLTPAPLVELVASAPRQALESSGEWLPKLVGAGTFSLEGWFVVVYDGEGVPFYVSAVANRAGGGSSWIRADLAENYESGNSEVFIDPDSDAAPLG